MFCSFVFSREFLEKEHFGISIQQPQRGDMCIEMLSVRKIKAPAGRHVLVREKLFYAI